MRNLTISGKRKVPSRNTYIDIDPEILEHEKVLNETRLTHEAAGGCRHIDWHRFQPVAAFLVLGRRLQSS